MPTALSSDTHRVRAILKGLEFREGFECPPRKERGLVWESSVTQQLSQPRDYLSTNVITVLHKIQHIATLFPSSQSCWELTLEGPPNL